MQRTVLPTIRTVILVFALLLLWIVLVETGTRLPYLYRSIDTEIRLYLIFPLLLAITVFYAFIYRKSGDKTGFQQAIENAGSKKERSRVVIYGIGGCLLCPAGIAWTSIAFPAWAAQLVADTPYSHIYHIDDITLRSGSKWSTLFDLEMSSPALEPVTLRLNRSRYELNHWKSGDSICVMGRTSVFGTIIDETSRELSRCSGKRAR